MRARLLAFAISMVLGPGITACTTADLKAAGEPCFASSECDVGLTCDFGSDPPVCRTQQTNPGGPAPDAGIPPDARPGMTPDAGNVEPPDAGGAPPPDAAPVPPDAAPPPPDAAPPPPDAAPVPPDAAA